MISLRNFVRLHNHIQFFILQSSILRHFTDFSIKATGGSGVIFACLAHMKLPFIAEQPLFTLRVLMKLDDFVVKNTKI